MPYYLAEIIWFAGSIILQYSIPSLILLKTPKGSIFRYLTAPYMIWVTSLVAYQVDNPSLTRVVIVSTLAAKAILGLDLLLIDPIDEIELSRERPDHLKSPLGRYYHALQNSAFSRGINTPRQIKSIPPQPAFFAPYGSNIPRALWLLRQCTIFVLQYLVVDILQTSTRQKALTEGPTPSFSTPIEWTITPTQWAIRVFENMVTWFVGSRITLDLHYRAVSIIFNSFMLESPNDWPPAFSRMADAYTIRKFWGKFWHQGPRKGFTTMSNLISRDILRLSRPSILERYTNISIVFFLSALMHVGTDWLQGVPPKYSGAIAFFQLQALGIMLEDGVQALWSRLVSMQKRPSDKDMPTPFWYKLVGYIWIIAWFGITTTIWTNSKMAFSREHFTLVPYSIAAKVGFNAVIGTALVGSSVAWFAFGIEI